MLVSATVSVLLGVARKKLLCGVLTVGLLSGTSCRRSATGLPPQVADAVLLRGDLTPTTFRLSDLQALTPVTEAWTHHGQSRQITGVPLLSVLSRAGWSPGRSGKSVPAAEKHSGHKYVAIATAADGYQAVFSTGELAEESTHALVVWSVDGSPLPPERGPFRLVVMTDHGMSRSLFQLRSIDVFEASKLLSQQASR